MATVSTQKANWNNYSPHSGKEKNPPRALETDLPIEEISALAELESWRKEVNRPVYHVHKWWATRLGSVFRAILLAGNLDAEADVWSEFYKRHDFRDCVVLDPFMGSGTTIGEALKLGCRAVGVDINPVSYFQVKKALETCSEEDLWAAYARLEAEAAQEMQRFYRSSYQGTPADILYTFWVKVVACPSCNGKTRLFSKWIFSSNAYPNKKPESWAVCPCCGEVNSVLYTAHTAACCACQHIFDPQSGPVEGASVQCEECGKSHKILEVVRRSPDVLAHEIYALMLLLPNGRKVYKRPEEADQALYAEAERALRESDLPIPRIEIPPGHNTNQARSYNYRFWHEMFNARQLYALGTLLQGILKEPDRNVRECLLLLFSGVLEWNNMFCSFKGEGTGAVRPLFSHHILKPERTPLEANPWGTERSSGAFSTLFERRLMMSKRYCENPFELRVVEENGKVTGKKVHGINRPLKPVIASTFDEIATQTADVLLVAGDSSCLPLPPASIDLVVTDPPYFDNVHYSELADFFFAWLKLGVGETEPAFAALTSRSEREVQGKDAAEFGDLLGGVLKESARVLKPDGLLAFTFQHAREEAWLAVASAIEQAGLTVVATHPVKAEMAVAVPKQQAKEPINLDLIIVCRQAAVRNGAALSVTAIAEEAQAIVSRYNRTGRKLSRGDVRVILMGGFLKAHSAAWQIQPEIWTQTLLAEVTAQIEAIYSGQVVAAKSKASLQQELLLMEKRSGRLKYIKK
jgi:putative DNA methylase